MRRLLSLRVVFKAVVFLLAVKVSYTQTCQSCQYKATVNTTQIQIQVSAENSCYVYNTTFNQTGGSIVISDLTPGTMYSLFLNCTTECCSNFTTRPQSVRNVTVAMVTSKSVSLTWVKGEGKSPFFRVLWDDVENILNGSQSTSGVAATVAGLYPGTKHVFKVKSVATDNYTKGEVSQVLPVTTRPGIPENITADQRGNDSLLVSWSKPKGTLQQYVVFLGINGTNWNKTVLPPNTSVPFYTLTPGTVYKCTVMSVLGQVNTTSDPVWLATKNNPPDSVSITNPTNSSLTLTWSSPLLSGATDLSYEVSYSPVGSPAMVGPVNDTNFTLRGLLSGTRYNVSVSTIGPQDLRSSIVSLNKYTLPNPVMSLTSTTLSTNSLRLDWGLPLGNQSYYRYKVQTITPMYLSQNVSGNSANITGLNPGDVYNCSVTTFISSDAQAQPVYVLGYTKPTNVVNLKAEAINTTSINLTWSYPADYKQSYLYEADPVGFTVQNKITSGNSIIFDSLDPGTNYTFRVFTLANNQTSQTSDVSSFTKVGKATVLTTLTTNTTMRVTWLSPSGIVQIYFITIQQDQTLIQNVNKTTNEEVVFQNLQPGKNYTVTVITRSGQFEERSDTVTNATYPNAPNGLTVWQYTNSSISLKWVRPPNMSDGNYSFTVTYGDAPITVATIYNNITLNYLVSGTKYSFSVKTVGAMLYESSALTASQYTNPNPLSNLMQFGFSTWNITVTWVQSDAKIGYSYQVNVTDFNGTFVKQQTVTATTATIGELPSGGMYSVIVTTQSAGGTLAPGQSITTFTKPYPITNLVAITQNESAVFLNWTRPIGFPSGGSYYITTNCSGAQPNQTVQVETIYITRLEPGLTYFSTVYSQVNNITGDPVSIAYSTMPPKVSPEIMHVGTNGTIRVTWMSVSGVEKYIVSLDTAGSTIQTVNISNQQSTNQNLSYTFFDLLPATVYSVTITTVSGAFSEKSDSVTIATYPTRPQAITITDKTTDSITLVWISAPNMTYASFNYSITYETTGTNSSEITTTNTTQILSSLSSGTTYNISLETVGPMNLRSEPVFMNFVTTKPKSVTSLTVNATYTNNITVQWAPPSDYKEGYKYHASCSNGESKITLDTEFTFSSLVAGSNYSFSVKTLTADDTAGALVRVTGCTVASEVSVLNCVGPNKTEARLNLTWDNPPGFNDGFEIQLGEVKNFIPTCISTCQYELSGLAYYTDYTVSIMTKGCGEDSTVKSVSCRTGITDPPKTTAEGAVTAAGVEYNKFTLQLSSSLFNSTNGPIVGYGILVTSDTGSTEGRLANNYVTKTYADWTAGQTTTYLAIVQQFRPGGDRVKRSADTITVVVGDKTSWQEYVNGPLNAKGSYSYAVVIFTKLEVESGLISTTHSYFSITAFHKTPVDLPENPAVIGGAIGGGIAAIVIILIVIMIAVATFKRKKNKEDSPGVPIHSIRNKVSEPIKVEDYEAHYRRQRADSFCGFAEEFEDLKPVGIAQAKSYALAPENRAKNRYNNVLPYDNSRVRLSVLGSPFDDYINASNMPGYNSRKEFIAAQGPLACTVNDFWRMVWEKNVHTVVMLTRCNEQGRVKCEEYWPAETKHYGNLVVTTTSEIPLEDWTIRDFDVKNVRTAETRSVRHFHFTAWPDHGVPETTELLINFRHLVREHMDQYSRHSPTMVHCSAGVGRTGTFIAIDRLIFQIERDGVVDVYGIIHDLRMHRTLMVQTEDQYVFLNQCAIDIIRSRTGTNVDLIYQNTAALTIYENFEPMKKSKNGYHKA